MNQEYYKDLSLPPIPHKNKKNSTRPQNSQKDYESELHTYIGLLDNNELKQKLKTTLDKFLMTCSAKHDNLIDALITLDQSNQSLERRLCSQTDQCKKVQRDAAAYKTRYEHIQRRKSISNQVDINRRKASLISSNASCFSGASYTTATNSSASILSSSSSSYTQLSQVTDIIGSTVRSSSSAASTIFWYDPEQDGEGRGDDDFSIDFASVLSDQDSLSLPLEPRPPKDASPTPPVSPFDDNSQHREMESMKHEYSPSPPCSPFIINQHTCEPCESKSVTLKFGCGDGFWNAIAKSKSNKKEVEDMISKFLQRGGNPNVAKNSETVKNVKEGYGLIHAVIAVKNTAALKILLDAGANPNVLPLTEKVEDRVHPLVLAAKLGYMSAVRMLVEHGGAHVIESKGSFGESALHCAIQCDSDEMIAYLLGASQNKLLDKVDSTGATPLHYASITGRARLIEVLVQGLNGHCDPRDHKGETPLHYAVRHRKYKAVAALVGNLGADPNPYIHKQVPTPYELAKAGNLKTIAEYLRQRGGKTTKEMEKATKSLSSVGSTMSGGSNSSASSGNSHEGTTGQSSTLSVRHFLHTKTSQILRGSF